MWPDARVLERVETLGRVGESLFRLLPEGGFLDSRSSTTEKLLAVDKIRVEKNPLAALACSLLESDMVIQVDIAEFELLALMDSALMPINEVGKKGIIDLNREAEFRFFPVKPANAASTKSNIFFTDAWFDLKSAAPLVANEFMHISGRMIGLYNDQAAAALILACALRLKVTKSAELAIRMLHDPGGCKAMSTIIKSSGMNGTMLGAMLCEAQTLGGRSINVPDLKPLCSERVGAAGEEKAKSLFSDDELRDSVRAVLEEEIDLKSYRPTNLEDFWSSRWLWCVNGSHGRALERHEKEWAISYSSRAHRRVAMENWARNPTPEWDGTTYVSASVKLEHGKSRLLLSCDTRNYTAFCHLLSDVEKCWRNKRTILDPGSFGYIKLCDKVRALTGSIYVMMDYDDFNAQHTIKAQQIVIEETGNYVGYDKSLLRVLIKSFERMMITCEGEDVGYATSTLMSGHRGTTFINSVLNSAYVRASAPGLWNKFNSLHTGDDIVSRFTSYSDVAELFDALKKRGVKMNPMKQSVGAYTAEFLRLAITADMAVGYVCRAIASSISGNWSNDKSLPPNEVMRSMMTSSRSIINRCDNEVPAMLLVSAVSRTTSISKKIVKRLLTGLVALGSGPVFSKDEVWRSMDVVSKYLQESDEEVLDDSFKAYATTDFLSKHVTPIERLALNIAGVSVRKTMLGASYAKSQAASAESGRQYSISLTDMRSKHVTGVITEADVPSFVSRKGVLSRFPILQLVKDRLKEYHLRTIFAFLGLSVIGDIQEMAWGSKCEGLVVIGRLPYAEAASIGSRVGCKALYLIRNIYM